jgi:hypothetical protein
MSFDRQRARRVVGVWVDNQQEIIREQTSDEMYTSPEQLLEDTAESFADLEAMKGLHKQLERDCE